jgi:hypothetical protein
LILIALQRTIIRELIFGWSQYHEKFKHIYSAIVNALTLWIPSGFQMQNIRPGMVLPPPQFHADHPFYAVIAMNGVKSKTFGALFSAKLTKI